MANRQLTADVIAKVALPILENELGVLKRMHRAHESEFTEKVNGYKIGDTVSIRRPADFTVRSGATMATQDVIEGKVALTIDQQKGVDFQFSQTDLMLKVEDLGERVLKPAMSRLVNEIAADVLQQMYYGTYHWVNTTAGYATTIDSFPDFLKGPERMDLAAMPSDGRACALHPTDFYGLAGAQAAMYVQDVARGAYRSGELGMLAGVDTLMTQVLPVHTNGTWDDSTPLVRGASQNVTYDSVKDTWAQNLSTDGWDASVTITKGSVFTIADCYMVNPKTKVRTGVLQPFVVNANVTADGTPSNETVINISPPIITSGPHQTVEFTSDMNDNAIVPFGAASAVLRQNLMFHKNAMALAIVPRGKPPGAVDVSTQTYKGISISIEAVRDGINDISKWRCDIIYGRKLIDPRLSLRING